MFLGCLATRLPLHAWFLFLPLTCPLLAQEHKSSIPPLNAPIINSIGMKLMPIPAGNFTMGLNRGAINDGEKLRHEVTLSHPFYIACTQVTQAQFQAVMGKNPSKFPGEDRPVENVSWLQAQAFCEKLSDRERKKYHLPTEAEWEYACRAGSDSDARVKLDTIAWFQDNSGDTTHPVGKKLPNAWGLFDMRGNVLEWCQDWYGEYTISNVVDPVGPTAGLGRVLRGGCWGLIAEMCTSTGRLMNRPENHGGSLGFRVVLDTN
jgi:formylglycine-generating enzyme required for sulfatase activity